MRTRRSRARAESAGVVPVSLAVAGLGRRADLATPRFTIARASAGCVRPLPRRRATLRVI